MTHGIRSAAVRERLLPVGPLGVDLALGQLAEPEREGDVIGHVKRQPGGTWYIGIFNTDMSAAQTFRVQLAQLGLRHPVRAADVWTGRSLGLVGSSYSATIAPGGVSLIAALGAA